MIYLFMQTRVLSKGEKQFITKLISKKLRLDGRDFLTSRNHSIEMNPLPLSPSSCKVRWGNSYGETTEIIVSVTNEVSLNEKSGFSLSVKSLPGAFGPQIESGEICNVISTTLQQFLINSDALNQNKFVIYNSNYSWKLFIDVLVIQACSAVFDAAMVGIFHSLKNLSFPQLIVTPGDSAAELHFDIDDSKHPEYLLDTEKLPKLYSFSSGDKVIILDPSSLEVSALGSLLIVAASNTGSLLGLSHFGETGLSPSVISDITQIVNQMIIEH